MRDILHFSVRTLNNLGGVYPPLSAAICMAIAKYEQDFPGEVVTVTDGVRSENTQAYYVSKGLSRTMKSKHLTGDAVDVAIIVNRTMVKDSISYEHFARLVQGFGAQMGLPIAWGGDWESFPDGCHFECGSK